MNSCVVAFVVGFFLTRLYLETLPTFSFLHSALAAAQCIVIDPVCGFVAVFVCGSGTTIARNCVHRCSPNWVCR